MNVLLRSNFQYPNTDKLYATMLDLSNESFIRNMKGIDACMFLDRVLDSFCPENLFRAQALALRELTGQGHNVLMVDADTLCVKSCEFPTDACMRLYAWTDVPGVYNGGVLFMPSAFKLWKPMDMHPWSDDWNCSQLLWGALFRQQQPLPPLDESMNWQPFVGTSIPRSAAIIIHYHASRGVEAALTAMKGDWS